MKRGVLHYKKKKFKNFLKFKIKRNDSFEFAGSINSSGSILLILNSEKFMNFFIWLPRLFHMDMWGKLGVGTKGFASFEVLRWKLSEYN